MNITWVHIIIEDRNGEIREAFELDADYWLDNLNDTEDNPMVNGLLAAFERDCIVRVRQGSFNPLQVPEHGDPVLV